MDTNARQQLIVDRVLREGAVTVAALVAELGASEATVRRDLVELDARGELRRVHGGARSAGLRGREPGFGTRAATNLDGKRRIARAVAGLLTPGEAVVLDSGTTCVEVAGAIADRELRVVPLSVPALRVLADAGTATLTVPAGDVRPREQSFTGPLTERTLAGLRTDTAVISPCAASLADGATAFDAGDAAVKQAAMASAARTVLVCDTDKWGRAAFARFAGLEEFAVVVTDRGPTDAEASFFAEHGVEVVVA